MDARRKEDVKAPMDKSALKERIKRLREVNQVIEKLDPAIRHDAFVLLADYVAGALPDERGKVKDRTLPGAPEDPKEFLAKFDHEKPADNVKLIAAYFYSQFGTAPFTTQELEEAARDAGLIIPDRPDATLAASARGGKRLFKKTQSGAFAPTVHGEKYLKEAYSITKGTHVRPNEESA